jgi:hypothetical protein
LKKPLIVFFTLVLFLVGCGLNDAKETQSSESHNPDTNNSKLVTKTYEITGIT